MPALIEPNIHPILVHFAYGLTSTGAIFLLLVALSPAGDWRDRLKSAGDWMLAVGVLAIVATIAAGFQAYYSVAHDAPSHAAMTTHRNIAVPSGAAIIMLGLWRWTRRSVSPSLLFSFLLLAAAFFLSVTAWWGGRLVFGHGLGVASLPAVTGDGHDHDHGEATVDETESDEAHHEDEASAAHEHDAAPEEESTAEVAPAPVASDAYPETAEAVVDAYANALRASDEAAIRLLVMPDVIIAEGGGAERSLEEYASHHMPADMAFMAALNSTRKKRDTILGGDLATVITQSQIHGTYKDKAIHLQMMETMVLRRVDDQWRIVHIHWSSSPITGEHEH